MLIARHSLVYRPKITAGDLFHIPASWLQPASHHLAESFCIAYTMSLIAYDYFDIAYNEPYFFEEPASEHNAQSALRKKMAHPRLPQYWRSHT